MISARFVARGTLSVLAGAVLLTNGCTLPHAPLRVPEVSYGELSPQQFCPGDTITARYDLTAGAACVSRPGSNCATAGPTIDITSTPMSFPPRSTTGLIDSFSFTTEAPRVDVQFTPVVATRIFSYPVVDAMSGSPAVMLRSVSPVTRSAERIDGMRMQTLDHGGMCMGSTPVNAPAMIAGLPQFSENLRLRTVRNINRIPIQVTLTAASGNSFTRDIMPGETFDTSEPGVLPEITLARTVSVRPMAVDPSTQCTSLQNPTPPPNLRTEIALSCGN